MKSRSSALPRAGDPKGFPARIAAYGRIARSLSFFAAAIGWLALPLGLVQRLVLWPLATLFPQRHAALMRPWFRFHARAVLGLARVFAGVRLRVRGRMEPGPSVIVMNHQSVLDIPVVHAISPDPFALIATRTRYARGIPGVSPLVRLARYPLVRQKREALAQDLAEMTRGADMVAAGGYSLAIFPEGHRTRDGEIGAFMTRGLQMVLARARKPVWCTVADGMWGARTFAEAAYRMAGAEVDVRILGPFHPPANDAELPAFIQGLRESMVAALHEIRAEAADRAA